MKPQQRDYSTVSPSAKSLLMMKAYTTIPYAKQAADLVQGPEVFDLNFEEKDFWFWIRVMHFENRYASINQLLGHTHSRNVLELSSGYSFRGIDYCKQHADAHYIDTDLPEVVAIKQNMIEQLTLEKEAKGNFELLPLNALDPIAFRATIARFNEGPISIINEGLLMYLDMVEKKQLCNLIHTALKARGGCWITADVYVQRSAEMQASLPQSKSEAAFMEQHNIEQNKFASYDAARLFFEEQGFEVVEEAIPDYASLSVMPHLKKVLPEAVRNSKEPPPKVQATWLLRAK
ncbi:MAG: class I SAM-dependent methyltransferase [Taibaiella sp.]|nr:class I SAM-dependent methyltransferase [Taibaiella sp.]